MAIESAPMYIAVAQAKKRAKNPPAAAKDISSDMTMAFMVAVRKKSINTSSPVRDTKETVPTEITRRARRGLPRRVHTRTSLAEFLEASGMRGALSATEFLIRRSKEVP